MKKMDMNERPERKSILQTIRDSRSIRIAIAAAAVLVLILIAALIVHSCSVQDTPADSQAETTVQTQPDDGTVREASFYEGSDYPVGCSQNGDGLRIDLDGSRTPELTWSISCEPEELVSVEYDGEETGGMLGFTLRPQMSGYASVICERNAQIAGSTYAVARIRLNVVVAENQNSALYVTLTDILQTHKKLGAMETKHPYLIDGTTILFPNGGDWTLAPEHADSSAAGMFSITEGISDEGMECLYVGIDPTAAAETDPGQMLEILSEPLVLESKTLGISRKFLYSTGSEGASLTVMEE